MFLKIFLLQNWQRTAYRLLFAVFSSLFFLSGAYASPGAHGPNGEHLDTTKQVSVSNKPKFESFTETFELAGELSENQLLIYLHDFKSNAPISGASIEIELGDLSASATYSAQMKAYTLSNEAIVALLNQRGTHEIVLTIMTEDLGDLLVAYLANEAPQLVKENHNTAHHHETPWWGIAIGLMVFVIGFWIGRQFKERK
ncbi:hypothetical protein [Pseudoalteromonas sp. Of7M-16]|uniref:hypothetical protein n=1 Tax=Pseudoalteromonas sp. Of7M-16 TaxID=2917756 RepID=UPI001EF72570|nr:hypothetical protein [Pseudoalteromonas sp. Of7M-16]MCG7551523.1 hypothetical protein [Pseudoalteromonas sp. Of7M-16]